MSELDRAKDTLFAFLADATTRGRRLGAGEGAILGRHLSGPARGTTCVALPDGLLDALARVLGAVTAADLSDETPVEAAPVSAEVLPPLDAILAANAPEPKPAPSRLSTNRFRGIMDD